MHCVWCWVPWAWVGYLVHSVEGTPFVLPYYTRGHQHHVARKPWVACTLLRSGTRTTTTTTKLFLVNESWKLDATTTCICSLLGFSFFFFVGHWIGWSPLPSILGEPITRSKNQQWWMDFGGWVFFFQIPISWETTNFFNIKITYPN